MGVSLNFCLAEQCDCKTALFNDTTGVYDAVTNEGGWGAPNTLSSAITSATIEITPKGYIYPITFTFTINNNVITFATRTDEFGSVTDITPLLSVAELVFPFFNFEFNSNLLFQKYTNYSSTGYISGTTLTIVSVDPNNSINLGVGSVITGAGISANTTITAIVSVTNGVGTYTVNNSQTVGSVGTPIGIYSIGNPIPTATSTVLSELADGSYLVTYECTDGTDTFLNQQWVFFTCLSKRCKDDTVVKGAAGHVTTENQIKIFLNYEYLLGGVSLGDKDFVDAQVDAMASLCLSCGCGCGC
jgi:hypothetical protein